MTGSIVPEGVAGRLGLFAVVLLLAFGAAYGAGSALDREADATRPAHHPPAGGAPTSTVAPGAHDMEGMGS